MNNLKQQIQEALIGFESGNPAANATRLLNILGYESERTIQLSPNNYKGFGELFQAEPSSFDTEKAKVKDWQTIDIIFQLTEDDIKKSHSLFETKKYSDKIIESYLFFALSLTGDKYTRGDLVRITREINKLTPMPAMILFKYNNYLTVAVIDRRLHKRESTKDVLEKVTLIKDINIAKPHRAHVEILHDLSFDELQRTVSFTNFVELHNAWRKTFDTSELNKKFFRELANWYFWALSNVEFPDDVEKNKDIRNAISVIRMITRIIFVWFLKEKGLVPDSLFIKSRMDNILNYSDKTGSTFYKAILQNLFFATLNTEMNKDKPGNRIFVNRQYGIPNLYRHERLFKDKDKALALFESIPFLNGGLFECLDKNVGQENEIRIDCFSNSPAKSERLTVPDELFFSAEQSVDLNEIYGTKNKTYKVRGLIDILDSYKFTVDENTPIEEEIALDPELLGKVFENLLASYNPETQTTARKQTGSFYTPREIVNYMVDESIIAYLSTKLIAKIPSLGNNEKGLDERLRHLVAYNDQRHEFTTAEADVLISAINTLKALDPACGSGAFPMGMLHKLVYILGKLDPDNSKWRELQRQKAIKETEEAYNIGDKEEREKRLLDISEVFENNASDYGRKLYLIENCIFGVDIQPIAVQIAKLRFFVSLIVDQRIDPKKANLGVRPLPNLETKFVAANTLIGIEKPAQMLLRNPMIDKKEEELKKVRERHFTARTPQTKEKYRKADEKLRAEISELLKKDGFPSETTEKLAKWNPYDQNASADFFDIEWMFGVTDGFDVVIGNPPYINIKKQDNYLKAHIKANYKYSNGADIYVAFIEKSLSIINQRGTLSFIVPNKFFGADYGKKLREHFQASDISILSIWDLKDEKVFEAALISTIVLIVQKGIKRGATKLLRNEQASNVANLFDNRGKIQIEADSDDNKIVDKINQFTPLSDIADIRTGIMGFEYWKMEPIICSGLKAGAVRLYTNGNFNRYTDHWSYTIKLYKKEYSQPSIKLDKQFLNGNTIELFKHAPKIIVRGVSKRLAAIIDYEGSALLVAVHSIIPRDIDMKYLLAILNSDLLNWYHLHTIYSIRIPQGSLKYPISFFDNLPIAVPNNKTEVKVVVALVDQVLASKKKDPSADTSALEKQIDEMVYALYGLTPEEIAIVEGKG